VASNPFVLEAWQQGAELTVHGWCYALQDGLINDLGARVSQVGQVAQLRR
jgi:carbonic anhydrase